MKKISLFAILLISALVLVSCATATEEMPSISPLFPSEYQTERQILNKLAEIE